MRWRLLSDGRLRHLGLMGRDVAGVGLGERPIVRTLEGHTGWVNSVAVTPDGKRAISASSDRTLRVWDLESGQSLAHAQGHKDRVNSVAVTPDGKRAISASSDRTLRVWDLEKGRLVRTLEGHLDVVNAVAVTPDGRACRLGLL